MPHYYVYQTIRLVHYVEAPTEEAARDAVEHNAPLSPKKNWDTDIDANLVTLVKEYNPEG